MRSPFSTLTWAALFAVYVVWATSYLAIKEAVAVFPPLLLVGLRSLMAAGALALLAWRLREARPTPAQARGALMIGALMIGLGDSLLALGLQSADSGRAAVLFAAVPILAALLLALRGQPLSRGQWAGAVTGLAGVALLNLDPLLGLLPGQAQPAAQQAGVRHGEALVLASAACFALSAVLVAWQTERDRMPGSSLWSVALQLLAGGLCASALGLLRGEQPQWPGPDTWAGLLYLSLVISGACYLAYGYLLRHTGTLLATSYAYVNPPVAVAIGVLWLGEALRGRDLLAMALVLAGVALTVLAGRGGSEAVTGQAGVAPPP